MSSMLTAMPQLIPQSLLNLAYVNKWKVYAEKYLAKGTISPVEMPGTKYPLYHIKKSAVSGVWVISLDGKTVDYIYAYSSFRLKGKHKASEALAYLFNPQVRGVTKEVFFDFLLPELTFVVTDSVYTPDGHKWFQAEYNWAFARGFNVYALDLTKKVELVQIDKEAFYKLQPLYWGKDKIHQKYRFAIELPSAPTEVV